MKTAPRYNFVTDDGHMVANGRLASGSPLPGEGNTRPIRESAEISAFPGMKRPPLPRDMARVYKRLFEGAFPRTSQNKMCEDAGAYLGCSPDTIDRIITGGTVKADAEIILGALWYYEAKTSKPFELAPGILARVVAAE